MFGQCEARLREACLRVNVRGETTRTLEQSSNTDNYFDLASCISGNSQRRTRVWGIPHCQRSRSTTHPKSDRLPLKANSSFQCLHPWRGLSHLFGGCTQELGREDERFKRRLNT